MSQDVSYQISSPGNEPLTAYCDRLREAGLTLNMTDHVPVITCTPGSLSVDEDTITTNDETLRSDNGYIFLAGQVIHFELAAADGIVVTEGTVTIEYQSDDGSIHEVWEARVEISDAMLARPV